MRCLLAPALALCFAAPAQAEMFDCVITPSNVVRVGSPVSGLLDEVFVDQGDLVKPGQRLATLRSEVERTSIEVLALQADSAAEIEAQQSRLTLSEKRLERVQKMVKSNVATREQLEAAEAETEVIERELAIAEMRQQVARLELERARRQLAQREIISPIEGVVIERRLFSGEFLHQESHVVTLAQINPLRIEAYLPVSFYGDVEPGMILTVHPDAPVQGVFDARVDVVDRVFDAASGTFGIRLEFANPDLSVPAGHRCRIELTATGQ